MTTRHAAGALLGSRIPSLLELWRRDRALARRPEFPKALSPRELEAASLALLALQRGLTGERDLAGGGYMEDRDLLGAYLLYYWPVSYMQASLCLAERPFAPARVLDLGSGPGPASAAILDTATALPGARPSVEELVLVDGSKKALDLAVAILGQGPRAPARLTARRLDLESGAALPEGSFDLIVFGHCLNELWARDAEALARRVGLVERAAERLAPGGRILLLEPALLATCRGLIGLRDALAAREWEVLGPCPGPYPCPALAAGPARSCHAESPWEPPAGVAALARAAGLDRSSVKFAYFFLAPPRGTAGAPGQARVPRPETVPRPEAVARTDDRRVVSEPMLNKAGRLRYVLCGDRGLETLSARADDETARALGFMDLRRGDLLRPLGLERRQGGGFGIVPGSELGLVARAPEASP